MIARENAQVAFLRNPVLWPFKTICPVRRNTVRDSDGRPQLGVVRLWPAGYDRDAEVVPVVFEVLLHDALNDRTGSVLARAPRHEYDSIAAMVGDGWVGGWLID